MKNTIILLGIILMSIINLNAQDCYTVKEINNKTENPDLSSKRFTFGIKQKEQMNILLLTITINQVLILLL